MALLKRKSPPSVMLSGLWADSFAGGGSRECRGGYWHGGHPVRSPPRSSSPMPKQSGNLGIKKRPGICRSAPIALPHETLRGLCHKLGAWSIDARISPQCYYRPKDHDAALGSTGPSIWNRSITIPMPRTKTFQTASSQHGFRSLSKTRSTMTRTAGSARLKRTSASAQS